MPVHVLEFLAGLALVAVTFRDVVQTVVVPGGARNSLHVSRRLVRAGLPIWTHGFRRPIGVSFAPTVLIASFAVWVLLLIVGYALMVHATAWQFDPPLRGFGDALFAAGSAVTTVGTGPGVPRGLAACVTVVAGLTGLASMTMAVTYALEVQATVHERDRGVLKIATSAGQPPSALVLLEHYAALGCRSELAIVLRNARDWCAAVLQSHSSHPWLIYFRTPSAVTAWPTSLGVVLDLGLIVELLLDEGETSGLGGLARRQASTLATDLVELLRLGTACEGADVAPHEIDDLLDRLRRAGYTVRDDADAAHFHGTRARHAAPIEALCRHLGATVAPLAPPPTPLDDAWPRRRVGSRDTRMRASVPQHPRSPERQSTRSPRRIE